MTRDRFPVTNHWIKEWVQLRQLPEPPTFAKIAAEYGVCPAIVHRYVKREIGLTRTRRRKRSFSWEEARRLEDVEGWTRTRIAQHFKVTGPAITQALGPRNTEKHDPWQNRRAA